MDYEKIYRDTGFDFIGDSSSFRGGLNSLQKRYCDMLDQEDGVKLGNTVYQRSHLTALVDPVQFITGFQDYMSVLYHDGIITKRQFNRQLAIGGKK